MTAKRRFSRTRLDALAGAKIVGVRSGAEHRYTGVWVVVIEDRVFARSWSNKPSGWFRAFRSEPRGSLEVGEFESQVRARAVRSLRLRNAVSKAFREKYDTPGSRKWVLGFARPSRAENTIEFLPG